jgi:class 3 adenylate cyclase
MSPEAGVRQASEAVAHRPAHAEVAGSDPPLALEAGSPSLYPVSLSVPDTLPIDEWKVVTILCGALVAPAVQGAQRCLETWQRRLHTLYELAHHIAQGYGGLVRAVGGDGVLIVFGAPIAQEDHAQRAVLTALDMQRYLAGWQGTRASPDVGALQVRMGLHTGRAAVG